ncbi:MAG: TolC family protein [Gammaproteobacteria bacterium]|nr:TolC family protein [Gammaproteobacteria bacterium]
MLMNNILSIYDTVISRVFTLTANRINSQAVFMSTVITVAFITAFISTPVIAQQWTLESSVQQAMSISPELQKSTAEIGSLQADVNLSTMWPDPEIQMRVDNMLGQDDGAGGYDLTDITVWQSIPMSRIKYQESASEASLRAAKYFRQYQSLQVQSRASKVFHQLQFATAKLALAEKQLKFANEINIQNKKNSSATVVRYITPLEKMRLGIIREEARQATANAEGKYKEVLSEFVKLLGIEMNEVNDVSRLQAIDAIPDIDQLKKIQNAHAQLSGQKQKVEAANHNINVARSSQSIDPSIGLSWSRDSLSIGRTDVYAIMLNVQIPFSDRKNVAQSKATYQASQQKIEYQLLKRELRINLNRSFAHLNHVIAQAMEYESKVLKPSSKMLALTNDGFASGELSILSLVDANNTFFESRLTYLNLLYQARVELAEVKLYAGQSTVDTGLQHLSLNTQGE